MRFLFFLISDTSIISKSGENKENCHKVGTPKRYLIINLCGKLFSFGGKHWPLNTF